MTQDKVRWWAAWFVWLGSVACAWSVGGAERPFQPWRCAAHGGVNALYCYLRVNGVACQYDELIKQQNAFVQHGPHTVATLAQLSARNGLPLQPVSLTMEELMAGSYPVIVHMDGESPEAGAFLLVFGISKNGVSYVNGPTASIHEMSLENFRRVWSGVALLPKSQRRQNAVFYLAGFGMGGLLPLVFRFARKQNTI